MCVSDLKTNPKGSVSVSRAIQKSSEEQVFVGKYFHPVWWYTGLDKALVGHLGGKGKGETRLSIKQDT